MQKNEKGVTLVALVVIIVLLIVVVTVAISFAFGKNGWGLSSSENDEYYANTNYKLDTFMNETEARLQQLEANESTQDITSMQNEIQSNTIQESNNTINQNQINTNNENNTVANNVQ